MQFRDDNQCIAEVLKGDTASYAWLVDRYKDMVFTLVMRVSRDREDAEEIIADLRANQSVLNHLVAEANAQL
ncbi:MAG: hypothetical protein P8Y02_14805 [Deinococcales bacterium]